MDIETFREFCLSLPEVTEEFPFGPDTLVYKVNGKVFVLTNLELFTSFNVKCDPEEAIELRERYPAVRPGYHMNKKHWNTVDLDNTVSDKMLKEWIMNSYKLVYRKKKSKTNKR
jgi:predicted DNA-binding protein (MmcQ/YjbR family)